MTWTVTCIPRGCGWRTAHHRRRIDLFDRRMKLYLDCRDVLEPIMSSPASTTDQNSLKFKVATRRARDLMVGGGGSGRSGCLAHESSGLTTEPTHGPGSV